MLAYEQLATAIPDVLEQVTLDGFGAKISGKVRDIYHHGDQRILITTDRVSAFDRVLGCIPYKGQVLNQLSAWWFEQTRDIVADHMIATTDPNVMVAQEAQTLPVEVVVRGYITGVTSTALWTLYEKGERKPYGIHLPEDLKKNDPLPQPIITPTTKVTDGGHDERLTRDEVLARGLVDRRLWAQVEDAALALFARGGQVARDAGLILVDTKYEFGVVNGRLTLIDEIHTPDSSRYWTADSYGEGREPENFDKEYLRLWFVAQGYKGEGTPPTLPEALIVEVAGRYIGAYERLTGQKFVPGEQPADKRVAQNLLKWIT